MDRKKLFKTLASLIVFIFAVNYVAGRLYWYISIWYFDMFMHFLGGFWIGLAIVLLLTYKKPLVFSLSLFFQVFLGVLLIGVLWEVFEVVVNSAFARNPFNMLDTASDIFFDVAGGTFAVWYLLHRIMSGVKNKVQL